MNKFKKNILAGLLTCVICISACTMLIGNSLPENKPPSTPPWMGIYIYNNCGLPVSIQITNYKSDFEPHNVKILWHQSKGDYLDNLPDKECAVLKLVKVRANRSSYAFNIVVTPYLPSGCPPSRLNMRISQPTKTFHQKNPPYLTNGVKVYNTEVGYVAASPIAKTTENNCLSDAFHDEIIQKMFGEITFDSNNPYTALARLVKFSIKLGMNYLAIKHRWKDYQFTYETSITISNDKMEER